MRQLVNGVEFFNTQFLYRRERLNVQRERNNHTSSDEKLIERMTCGRQKSDRLTFIHENGQKNKTLFSTGKI
jgi:hypothetical protein